MEKSNSWVCDGVWEAKSTAKKTIILWNYSIKISSVWDTPINARILKLFKCCKAYINFGCYSIMNYAVYTYNEFWYIFTLYESLMWKPNNESFVNSSKNHPILSTKNIIYFCMRRDKWRFCPCMKQRDLVFAGMTQYVIRYKLYIANKKGPIFWHVCRTSSSYNNMS